MAKKSSSDAELVFVFLYKVIKFFFTGFKGIFVMFKDMCNLVKNGFNKSKSKSANIRKDDNKIKTNVINESIINSSLNNHEESMSDYDRELEERMNNLDLEEWQKDLVREGKYDPENFEEDDSSDEDDYYHEDDD